ncbi:hypothetical protein DFH09DRAFT_955339, partial [Mycena vulgaris]
GDDRDLETAVEKLIKAESLLSWGHNARAAIAANMSFALAERFKRHSIIAHIKHSIELQQEALDLLPHSLPESAHGLNNLSIALQKLFTRQGDLADLEKHITLHREFIDISPLPLYPAPVR